MFGKLFKKNEVKYVIEKKDKYRNWKPVEIVDKYLPPDELLEYLETRYDEEEDAGYYRCVAYVNGDKYTEQWYEDLRKWKKENRVKTRGGVPFGKIEEQNNKGKVTVNLQLLGANIPVPIKGLQDVESLINIMASAKEIGLLDVKEIIKQQKEKRFWDVVYTLLQLFLAGATEKKDIKEVLEQLPQDKKEELKQAIGEILGD